MLSTSLLCLSQLSWTMLERKPRVGKKNLLSLSKDTPGEWRWWRGDEDNTRWYFSCRQTNPKLSMPLFPIYPRPFSASRVQKDEREKNGKREGWWLGKRRWKTAWLEAMEQWSCYYNELFFLILSLVQVTCSASLHPCMTWKSIREG